MSVAGTLCVFIIENGMPKEVACKIRSTNSWEKVPLKSLLSQLEIPLHTLPMAGIGWGKKCGQNMKESPLTSASLDFFLHNPTNQSLDIILPIRASKW